MKDFEDKTNGTCDAIDGQNIQTQDNYAPHAPKKNQIVCSSSKGWDWWTKEINPPSMTYHAQVV